MLEDMDAHNAAIDEIRRMLKDGHAKHMAALASHTAPVASVTKVEPLAGEDGGPHGVAAEHEELGAGPVDDGDGDEPAPKKPHRLVSMAMKRLDQVLRPKKD